MLSAILAAALATVPDPQLRCELIFESGIVNCAFNDLPPRAEVSFRNLIKVRESFDWHPNDLVDAGYDALKRKPLMFRSAAREPASGRPARAPTALITDPEERATDGIVVTRCGLGVLSPPPLIRSDFADALRNSARDVD